MQMIIEKGDGYCVVSLCDKDDFWSEVTAKARAEADKRRKAFSVVAGDGSAQ